MNAYLSFFFPEIKKLTSGKRHEILVWKIQWLTVIYDGFTRKNNLEDWIDMWEHVGIQEGDGVISWEIWKMWEQTYREICMEYV